MTTEAAGNQDPKASTDGSDAEEATATASSEETSEAAPAASPAEDAGRAEEAAAEPSKAAPDTATAKDESAGATPAAAAAGEKVATKKPAEPAAPARVLPSEAEIAAWAAGDDVPSIGTLFEGLKLARFDVFNTQIRSKELVPQHWQVIASSETPDDSIFDGLPEVGHLRVRYANQELARRRLGSMKVAWRELRGLRPGLWTVPDLLAALRRIIDKGLEVDFYELLSGARDLWLGSSLPKGREQAEILWACIALIRKGTKK